MPATSVRWSKGLLLSVCAVFFLAFVLGPCHEQHVSALSNTRRPQPRGAKYPTVKKTLDEGSAEEENPETSAVENDDELVDPLGQARVHFQVGNGHQDESDEAASDSSGASRAVDLSENDGPGVDSPTVVLTIRGDKKTTKGPGKMEGPDEPTTTSTLAPSIILSKNGTNFLAMNGTLAPATSKNASEVVEKAGGSSKLKKLVSKYMFSSSSNKDEYEKKFNKKTIEERVSETSSSGETVDVSEGRLKKDGKLEVSNTTTTSTATTTTTTSTTTGRPVASTTKGPDSGSHNSTTHPPPTSTTKPPSPSTTPSHPPSGSSSSGPSPTHRPPISTTAKSANADKKSDGKWKKKKIVRKKKRKSLYKEMKDSDRLLAVVITERGGFKGRRISLKTVESLMRNKLSDIQLDSLRSSGSIAISSNNSFVFPAGHYYFPHPVRVAGFSTP